MALDASSGACALRRVRRRRNSHARLNRARSATSYEFRCTFRTHAGETFRASSLLVSHIGPSELVSLQAASLTD